MIEAALRLAGVNNLLAAALGAHDHVLEGHWPIVDRTFSTYSCSCMGSLQRITAVFGLALVVGGTLASEPPKHVDGQTTFREDEPFQHPAPLTNPTLKVLLETEQAQQVYDPERDHPEQLFRAAEVHLCRPDEVDLIVIGIPPMSGAENGWIWLVRSARKSPQVVLFAGGNSLQLMNSRTAGCRDVRSVFSTASETRNTTYHFDGKDYKVWTEKWMENRK